MGREHYLRSSAATSTSWSEPQPVTLLSFSFATMNNLDNVRRGARGTGARRGRIDLAVSLIRRCEVDRAAGCVRIDSVLCQRLKDLLLHPGHRVGVDTFGEA